MSDDGIGSPNGKSDPAGRSERWTVWPTRLLIATAVCAVVFAVFLTNKLHVLQQIRGSCDFFLRRPCTLREFHRRAWTAGRLHDVGFATFITLQVSGAAAFAGCVGAALTRRAVSGPLSPRRAAAAGAVAGLAFLTWAGLPVATVLAPLTIDQQAELTTLAIAGCVAWIAAAAVAMIVLGLHPFRLPARTRMAGIVLAVAVAVVGGSAVTNTIPPLPPSSFELANPEEVVPVALPDGSFRYEVESLRYAVTASPEWVPGGDNSRAIALALIRGLPEGRRIVKLATGRYFSYTGTRARVVRSFDVLFLGTPARSTVDLPSGRTAVLQGRLARNGPAMLRMYIVFVGKGFCFLSFTLDPRDTEQLDSVAQPIVQAFIARAPPG
jgi:hypothetical protein